MVNKVKQVKCPYFKCGVTLTFSQNSNVMDDYIKCPLCHNLFIPAKQKVREVGIMEYTGTREKTKSSLMPLRRL